MAVKKVLERGSDPRAAYVPQLPDYGVPGENGASERLLCCNFGRMTKWVRRGFGPGAAFVRQLPDYGVPGEIRTAYAEVLSILAEYDKRGVNPLGSRPSLERQRNRRPAAPE